MYFVPTQLPILFGAQVTAQLVGDVGHCIGSATFGSARSIASAIRVAHGCFELYSAHGETGQRRRSALYHGITLVFIGLSDWFEKELGNFAVIKNLSYFFALARATKSRDELSIAFYGLLANVGYSSLTGLPVGVDLCPLWTKNGAQLVASLFALGASIRKSRE